jgi:SAM-dependent methyltransferase
MMIHPGPHQFDRRASQYEANAPVQREAAAWLAEWLPKHIAPPSLELGAGTGFFTRHLFGRAGGGLVVTDAAPRMVEAGANGLQDADWQVANADAPPEKGPYRWILSCSLVQWLADPAAVFRSWHRVAAPQARLLSGWFVRGTLAELFQTCPEAQPFLWREPREWIDLLEDSGWSTQRHETRRFVRRHVDSAAMLREIHNAGAVVPRRLGSGVLRRALRNYDRNYGDGSGVCSTFEFLRLEAVRR